MTQAIQDYRKFGFDEQSGSVALTEGDPAVEILTASESGLPNGTYIFHATTTWIQPIGKHMIFNGTVQGSSVGDTVHDSAHATKASAATLGDQVAVVVDGTLEIHLTAEFPDQTGSATGSIEKRTLTWERKLES